MTEKKRQLGPRVSPAGGELWDALLHLYTRGGKLMVSAGDIQEELLRVFVGLILNDKTMPPDHLTLPFGWDDSAHHREAVERLKKAHDRWKDRRRR